MKQVLQSMRTGETMVAEVPVPIVRPRTALVHTATSLVSAGTERMLVEFGEKSLLGKARSRPDLVRQVIDKARREGLVSTIEAAFNRLDQPLALGYASAGTIAEIGEELSGFMPGQRVACAGGNAAVHAEYGVVPKNLLTHLPDSVDFDSAAFATLGAIALHGFRLAEVQLGERVAVIGLGLLGLLAVQIIQAAGCHALGIDLNPERVALAARFGATAVERLEAEETAKGFSLGHGVDAVLICADTRSADPIELAGLIARDRARIVAVGAVGQQIPRKVYYEKELTFINSRSYGPGRYDPSYEEKGQDYPIGYVRWTEGRNLETFIDLIAKGSVDVHPLITHRFPVAEAPKAYELITGKTSEAFIAVLLTYPQHSAELDTDRSAGIKGIQTVNSQISRIQAEAIPRLRTDKIALGVLGAGNFARAVMLPAIQKVAGIEPVAIASGSGLSAQSAAKRYGYQYAASSPEQVFSDPSINTVAILTRHHYHAAQVTSGLQAGKHVFCEKPLALSLDDLEKIQALVEDDPSPLLTVGFNRRFAPLALKLAAFWKTRQEPLAISYRVNAGFISASHWVHDSTQGGGRIIGEACHFIDFIAFLIGSTPTTVRGSLLGDRGTYNEDNAILTFGFSDGSVGILSYLANGDKAFPKERVEVFGAGQVAVLEDFRSLELVKDGKREKIHHRLRQDKGHQAEWEVFAHAILSGGHPPIPYNQLFGVSRAAILALQALRSGETVRI